MRLVGGGGGGGGGKSNSFHLSKQDQRDLVSGAYKLCPT